MVKQIPGFYYDHEKRKYFRITPDSKSVVHTPAARYSRSAVQRRVEDAERENRLRRLRNRQIRHSVIRSTIFQDPCCISTLARETGYPSRLQLSELWGRQYSVKSFLKPSGKPIRGVTRPNSNIVEVAHYAGSGISFIANFDGQVLMKSDFTDTDLLGSLQPLSSVFPDPVISLTTSYEPTPLLVGGTQSGQLFISSITDILAPQTANRRYLVTEHLEGISEFKPNPSPSSSQCLIAVAGVRPTFITLHSSHVQYGETPTIGTWNDLGGLDPLHTNVETLCVAWQTPQVASWGCRNGGIDMTDIRAPTRSLRLKHASSVCKLQHLGHTGHHVLAAGLRNKLAMYDLRWCPPPSLGKASPTYLTYPSYSNKTFTHTGFDVSSTLELVAAANDRGGVTLFDLWKGTERAHKRAQAVAETHIHCIKFIEDSCGPEGIGRCLVGVNSDVESWIFGKQPEPIIRDNAYI